jgi:hypothetical protein
MAAIQLLVNMNIRTIIHTFSNSIARQKCAGILLLLFCVAFLSGCNDSTKEFSSRIEENYGKMNVELIFIRNGAILESVLIPLSELNTEVSFNGALWVFDQQIQPIEGREQSFKVILTATVKQGNSENTCLGLQLDVDDWDGENYVLMPGAAYNGNRYRSIIKVKGISTDMALERNPGDGLLMSNVPRLNYGSGESLLQLLSGDMATPAIGYHSKNTGRGIFLLTDQGTEKGDYSFKVWENETREHAEVTIRIPGFRQDTVFKGGGQPFMPTPDNGVNLKQGDKLVLECNIYMFDSPDIQSLFDYFAEIRKDVGDYNIPHEIPYSAAWEIMEEKYNRQNWVEPHGYYSVGMRESMYQDWQTGWVGGMNTIYPLLVLGADSTFNRAIQTFDFLFDTVSPSGLFYEVFYDGEWRLTDKSSFLRRNSDAFYFTMKSFDWLALHNFSIPENWLAAVRNCANRYVMLWEENNEFGQMVDFNTGRITASGTSSNGIAPAALALCSEWFDDPKYLNVAQLSAESYYQNYVSKGITNGGPGDIYQGMDSESAFGLLESFVVLFEVTGEAKWLQYAEETAKQCATWVTSYNFRFPEGSTFARLDMHTTGTVIANIQNKHASPGICTLSGSSLLKLYRYTGNKFYLELIADISKTIPQYMSRADRPIPDPRPNVPWPVMPPGWINERVNLSDWEERGTAGDIKRGEIFGGSTWSEAAFMNTYAEIPGIYVLSDTKEITILDNVLAEFENENIVRITNPTNFNTSVNVMIESSLDQTQILDKDYMMNFRIVALVPGESKLLEIE